MNDEIWVGGDDLKHLTEEKQYRILAKAGFSYEDCRMAERLLTRTTQDRFLPAKFRRKFRSAQKRTIDRTEDFSKTSSKLWSDDKWLREERLPRMGSSLAGIK